MKIGKISIDLAAILYTVVTIISIIVLQLNKISDIKNWIAFTVPFVSILFLVQLLALIRSGTKLLSIQVLFVVLLYIFYLGQNYLLSINYDFGELSYAIAYKRYDVPHFIASNKYSIICIITFTLGLVYSNSLQLTFGEKKEYENEDFSKRLGIFFLFFSIIPELYRVFSKAYFMIQSGYNAATEAANSTAFDFFSGIFFAGSIFYLCSLKNNRIGSRVLYIILVIFKVITMGSGQRAMAIIAIIIYTYVFLSLGNSLDKRSILRLIVAGLILLYLMIVIRNSREQGMSLDNLVLTTNGNIILDSISEWSITTFVITHAFLLVQHPANGMSLVTGFASVIPFWKKIFGDSLDLKYNTFYALDQQLIGSSFVSDFYFDFGYVGGVLACLIFGFIIGIILRKYEYYINANNFGKIGIYSFIVYQLLYTIRSYVIRLPRYYVYFIIFYLFAKYFTSHFRIVLSKN